MNIYTVIIVIIAGVFVYNYFVNKNALPAETVKEKDFYKSLLQGINLLPAEEKPANLPPTKPLIYPVDSTPAPISNTTSSPAMVLPAPVAQAKPVVQDTYISKYEPMGIIIPGQGKFPIYYENIKTGERLSQEQYGSRRL